MNGILGVCIRGRFTNRGLKLDIVVNTMLLHLNPERLPQKNSTVLTGIALKGGAIFQQTTCIQMGNSTTQYHEMEA